MSVYITLELRKADSVDLKGEVPVLRRIYRCESLFQKSGRFWRLDGCILFGFHFRRVPYIFVCSIAAVETGDEREMIPKHRGLETTWESGHATCPGCAEHSVPMEYGRRDA